MRKTAIVVLLFFLLALAFGTSAAVENTTWSALKALFPPTTAPTDTTAVDDSVVTSVPEFPGAKEKDN